MIIIPTSRVINFEYDYEIKHEKEYANEWFLTANKESFTYDLGIATDKRIATISIRTSNDEGLEIIDYFSDLSALGGGAEKIQIQLSEGEEIFGVELDYSLPLYVNLLTRPDYVYESLNWCVVVLQFVLDPSSVPTFKPTPSGYSWETLPWSMDVQRDIIQGRNTLLKYSGSVSTIYDDSKSYEVSASFTLEKNEAVWLKKTLLDLRNNATSMKNTYFNLTGIALDADSDITFKVKDYDESRSAINLYTIELTMVING